MYSQSSNATIASPPSSAQPPRMNGGHTAAVPLQQTPGMPDLELGRVLVDEGIVTADEIRRNLPVAEGSPEFLRLLLYCPVVSEHELAALLAARHQVPVLNLDAIRIPQSVLDRVPASVARQLECLPVASVGNLLCVGVASIRDHVRLLQLRSVLGGTRVKLFPCDPRQLRLMIELYYAEPVRPAPPPASQETAAPHPGALGESHPGGPEEAPTVITPQSRPATQKSGLPGPESPAGPGLQPGSLEQTRSAVAELVNELAKLSYQEDEQDEGSIEPPSQVGLEDDPAPAAQNPLNEVSATEAELSEEELEVLLAEVDEVENGSTDLLQLCAEPVSRESFEEQWAARSQNGTRVWERVHFSHAPLRAEPVVLGFPGLDPFDDAGNVPPHLIN